MMPANVQFKRGLLQNLPQTYLDGTIYVTTDEHAMYLDQGNQRIRLGDFVPVNTVTDLPAAGHAYETAMYYVRQGNILARWEADTANNGANARWIQINKAGVVGVTTSGSGSVISEITTTTAEDGTLRLAVTKTNVASTEDIEDLTDRIIALETRATTAEGKIDVINGDENTVGSIMHAAADVISTLLGEETQYVTLKALADQIRSLTSSVSSLNGDVSDLQDSVSSLTTTVNSHTTTLNTLTGDANTPGSVAAQVAAEATARQNADTALGNRLTSVENDINDLTPLVNANTAAINVLNGDGEGSVTHTVSTAIAEVVANAPEDLDTLKEIADWIDSHADSASAMNSAITSLQGDVSDLQDSVSDLTTDLSALTQRVTTAEGNITTNTNAITTLNGNSSVVGSVDYKIAQATQSLSGDLDDLTDRVAANESAIGVLNGDANTPNSVAAQVAAEAALREAADTTLTTNLGNLTTRVTTAENNITSLQTDVGDLTTMVNAHEAALTWQEFV